MLGHSKQVNAVAMRKDRPFRIATASEDQSCCFYHGPPFKLNKQIEVYLISELHLINLKLPDSIEIHNATGIILPGW